LKITKLLQNPVDKLYIQVALEPEGLGVGDRSYSENCDREIMPFKISRGAVVVVGWAVPTIKTGGGH